MQLDESPIRWVKHHNAVTTTSYPTASTDGVAPPYPTGGTVIPKRLASRVHVALSMSVAAGTLGAIVHVLGYVGTDSTGTTVNKWFYLGSMNSRSSIAVDQTKWSASSLSVDVAEVFSASGANFERYYTYVASITGTTPSITTYVGFPVE